MVSGNTLRRRDVCIAMGALVVLWAAHPVGQTKRTFTARLSTVPITVAMQDAVSGRGSAEATLSGTTLTIAGKFEGLRSPATVARVHMAPRGMRGPALGELDVSKAVNGTVAGSVTLTDRQIQALDTGGLYVQIHSEKAPDGNLWGWLFPREVTR